LEGVAPVRPADPKRQTDRGVDAGPTPAITACAARQGNRGEMVVRCERGAHLTLSQIQRVVSMTSRLLSIAVAVTVGVTALAGCAGNSTIYNSMISSAYRPYLYGYGAGRRDLTTIVLGNPFGLDQQQMEERLLAKFNARPTLLQPTHFTTTPGPSARPEFKAVLLFNRATVLPNQVCRAPEQVPVADLGSTMRLTATFCRGGYLSTVTGELENVTDIDDPRFERLIGQMVPLLFPPIDPTRENNGARFLISGARGGFAIGS
jgi:hypothetical protein